MQRVLRLFTVAACLVAAPSLAHASFHLWHVEEVFSSQSGDIQYVELSTTSVGQQAVNGHTITFTSGGNTTTFTFPGNTGTPTTNKHLLIATPGFLRVSGVTPDFTLPCGPLFDPTAATIVVDFGPGQDSLTVTTATLAIPTDGIHSLVNGAVAVASPQNFAAVIGTVALTTGQNDGTTDICDDGQFCNGTEACASSACTGTDPCPGALMCNETTDTCFECDDAGDCDDANTCTTDTCNGSLVCVHTPALSCCGNGAVETSEACDDGNQDLDDGCVACDVEAGFTCDDGEPTVCTAIPPDAGVPDAEPDVPPDAEVPPVDGGDDGCCATGGAPATGSIVLAMFALVSLGRARRARR